MKKALQVVGKIILSAGICFLLSVIFNLLVSLLLSDPKDLPELLVRLINGPKSLFVVLGSVVIMLTWLEKGRQWPIGFHGSRKIGLTATGCILSLVLVLLTFAAVHFIGEATVISFSLDSSTLLVFGVAAFLALCDTISEEVLFRGYIQGLVKSAYGSWSGIFISALPFALLHSLGHDVFSHPLTLLNLYLAGIYLAFLRELSGSLWLPLGAHFAWNLLNDVFGSTNSLVLIEWGLNSLISGGNLGLSKGLANTLIMVSVIAILTYRFRKNGQPQANLHLS